MDVGVGVLLEVDANGKGSGEVMGGMEWVVIVVVVDVS